MGVKVGLKCKGKKLLGIDNKLFNFKILLTTPSNVLPSHLKQTFPSIIWTFNQSEEDEVEVKLSSEIFSTLPWAPLAFPIFGKSVIPFPTGGGQIMPTNYYRHLQICWPSGILHPPRTFKLITHLPNQLFVISNSLFFHGFVFTCVQTNIILSPSFLTILETSLFPILFVNGWSHDSHGI